MRRKKAVVGVQLYQNPDLRVKINYKHIFEIDSESFRFKYCRHLKYEVNGALERRRFLAKIKRVVKLSETR